MSLFQKSVEQKYLKQFDNKLIEAKYSEFKAYFGNPEIQENIRNSKEEQFQEGFLRDLFVKILGYTLNPSPNFNLTTEYKNIKDSKKADGAIIIGQSVKGVIELKGTDTTDLSKVESQAFGYKNNQPNCIYIITSNFEKLRFYIDNAIEYIEFNLFTLTKQDFEILFLCLAYDSVAKGIPKKIKDESVSHEDRITKELYRDYSVFKNALYQNLVTLNPQFESLTLYKKSQKLLDRFLFLFFAEDRQLLPPNSVRLVLNDWKDLKERDVEIPLYNRYKKYFEYLNTGYKGKRYDVYAYNGGLFKPDEVLDNVAIDDDLLYKHTFKLSEYDFASEVDVNILGHIFENSLNELDEIMAKQTGDVRNNGVNNGVNPVVNPNVTNNIAGNNGVNPVVTSADHPVVTSSDHSIITSPIRPTVSKRKKDGVFYTPKYITKYIVENTVGRLCSEKKIELQINEEEYTTDKKRQLKTKQALLEKLNVYSNWLLQLTICDPACGSGAFLNQALDFLISEHRYIDELKAKLYGVPMILSDIEKSILENNLFGVDLNEESVEIAKLSLWLRTAQPNRKLNDLNNNIKCGNSLIDDPAIAGSKAFNWQKEFPQIFIEKEKKARHITWVTHNSRTSQRMIDNHVKKGEAFWIDSDTEIFITQCIRNIVIEDGYNVLEYNICGDHVHMLLVCTDDELPNIVRKLKGKSSQLLKERLQIPKEQEFHLWAQKFSETHIDSNNQFYNTIAYIANNREKHQLPYNNGLQPIVVGMRCTYDHAFRTEYKGGFDVVIGNPPYVNFANLPKEERDYFKKTFEVCKNKTDLYAFFVEKTNTILKKNGCLSFIFPHTWISTTSFSPLRKLLFENYRIEKLVELEHGVFQEAIVKTLIIVCSKDLEFIGIPVYNDKFEFVVNIPKEIILQDEELMINLDWSNEKQKIENRIFEGSFRLDSVLKFTRGIKTSDDSRFLFFEKNNDEYKKVIRGRNIKAYKIAYEDEYIWYRPDLMKEKEGCLPHTKDLFEVKEKLITQRVNSSGELLVTYDNEQYYCLDTTNVSVVNSLLTVDLKYLLVVLNSKLINWWFNDKFKMPTISGYELHQIPIKKISIDDQKSFIEKADIMLSLNKELQELSQKFQRTIQRKFETLGNSPLPGKLQDWYLLSYAEFIAELGKKKIKLSLSDEAEWEAYFLQESKKALELKTKIDTTDKEIDRMVYELYGLTEEEIKIVEGE